PDSKEYFILTRMAQILVCFNLNSKPYEQLVNFVAKSLKIINENQDLQEINPLEAEEEIIIEHIEKEVEQLAQKELSSEEKTACNIILQQLKVLQHNSSKDSINRIITHTTNVLNFIGIDADFEDVKDGVSLHEKLQGYIQQIDQKLFDIHFGNQTSQDYVEEIKETIQDIPATFKEEFTKNEFELVKDVVEEEIMEEEFVKNLEQPAKDLLQPKGQTPNAGLKNEPSQIQSIPKTVKIDQADIDVMMDIVGEILVMKNSLPYVANNLDINNIEQTKRELLNKYEEISRITAQLQDKVMGMRLLPLSYIFNRYPKLVRDISKRLNKEIRFEEAGGDTKLDKTMIEKLADPLI
ncbi:MAG: hypothetical protein IE909_19095, partial [Campylobacterales bacterium]|nr:hypothetical protein [Campylobacterales bacterium]